jgi:uncharacterized protein
MRGFPKETTMATTRKQVDDFLALRRIAFVGISTNPKAFSRGLWHELEKRGYEVVPVNSAVTELDGTPVHARIQDIQPPVQGALLMTAPKVTEQIVRDCAEVGIRSVWMYRSMGVGSVSQKAIEFCEANGISVVAGQCPYMFLPKSPVFHQLHALGKRLAGSYPK